MDEADPHDAANTALLLDREIDKRVGEALARLFECENAASCLQNGDMWGFKWHIAQEVLHSLRGSDQFRDSIIGQMRDQLLR